MTVLYPNYFESQNVPKFIHQQKNSLKVYFWVPITTKDQVYAILMKNAMAITNMNMLALWFNYHLHYHVGMSRKTGSTFQST